ncbi:chalcone isomerase family protein [Roseateles koreensis]|uniref:Chalcone isomerase family protein n=1 Tax=Roseateles koreensis TaxID=2987526 RepID=A0ABT5KU53_9BURK|nr:chalcone isomerase family protein [Roseateles koreensis]MDC8785287.1 chalcone isomerase family protein [Roseateles koreensis]
MSSRNLFRQSSGLSRRQALAFGVSAVAGSWLAMPAPAWAMKYEDQVFDDTLRLAGGELVLNGVGKRAGKVFRAYAAGLYLSGKSNTLAGVMAMPGPKRLQMRMTLDISVSVPLGLNSIPAEEFVKAVKVGVERNSSEAERHALADRVATFNEALQAVGKVRKKDIVNVDYLPDQGTLLFVNGKQWGPSIPGVDFYNAFLRCFIGDLPVDDDLKAGLLGLPVKG